MRGRQDYGARHGNYVSCDGKILILECAVHTVWSGSHMGLDQCQERSAVSVRWMLCLPKTRREQGHSDSHSDHARRVSILFSLKPQRERVSDHTKRDSLTVPVCNPVHPFFSLVLSTPLPCPAVATIQNAPQFLSCSSPFPYRLPTSPRPQLPRLPLLQTQPPIPRLPFPLQCPYRPFLGPRAYRNMTPCCSCRRPPTARFVRQNSQPLIHLDAIRLPASPAQEVAAGTLERPRQTP